MSDIIILLKCPPLFHLHHPCRWQQIFINNVSVHFSIHPSFNYMNFASATPWCFGGMWCAIWPQNMVCIMALFFSSSAIEPYVVSMNIVHSGWSPLLIVLFEIILHTYFQVFLKLSKSGPWPWTTLPIIIFTPLSEILWGVPGRGRFMVKLCSFQFRIRPQQYSLEDSEV